eukprot:3711479-Pleurochrysis_carterae.AAC.1
MKVEREAVKNRIRQTRTLAPWERERRGREGYREEVRGNGKESGREAARLGVEAGSGAKTKAKATERVGAQAEAEVK